MSEHEELLARLDVWAAELSTPFPQNEVIVELAARIRELAAAYLERDRQLRELREAAKEYFYNGKAGTDEALRKLLEVE